MLEENFRWPMSTDIEEDLLVIQEIYEDKDSEYVLFFDPQGYVEENEELKLENFKLDNERLQELAI